MQRVNCTFDGQYIEHQIVGICISFLCAILPMIRNWCIMTNLFMFPKICVRPPEPTIQRKMSQSFFLGRSSWLGHGASLAIVLVLILRRRKRKSQGILSQVNWSRRQRRQSGLEVKVGKTTGEGVDKYPNYHKTSCYVM